MFPGVYHKFGKPFVSFYLCCCYFVIGESCVDRAEHLALFLADCVPFLCHPFAARDPYKEGRLRYEDLERVGRPMEVGIRATMGQGALLICLWCCHLLMDFGAVR